MADELSSSFAIKRIWWTWGDSNPRPPACKAGALPTELHAHDRSCIDFRAFCCRSKNCISRVNPIRPDPHACGYSPARYFSAPLGRKRTKMAMPTGLVP